MGVVNLTFQEVYTEFRPKILQYLNRMVGEFEAEDLTQEVFVKVSRSLNTFRGESKLSTWIYRIATNAAFDKLRDPTFKRFTQAESLTLPSTDERPEKIEIEVVDQDFWTGEEAASLEQEYFLKERLLCYQKYVENLPVNYRAVIALSELGEMAAGEIADILGLSLDTVKIRLHRGRARLLKELRSHCQPEDWL
jgi:RNA polymerase sigma-70 factor (ECF subfamily)